MRRTLTTLGVLGVAALLRFWNLGYPDVLVFDELYYVRDAYSQLLNGYPTEWQSDENTFDGQGMLNEASYVAHPPLGKWLISLSMLVFGVESGWAWRAATALIGTATVALTMLLAWRMTKTFWIAQIAGLLLAVEGLHVTMSRVSLLDGHLTFLITAGALLLWQDHEWARARRERTTTDARVLGAFTLWRPWLIAAAGVFGLAAGVKWSAFAIFAVFLLWVLANDVIARIRSGASLAGLGTLLQTLMLAVPLIFTAIVTYLATWAGWLATSGGWSRDRSPWPKALWNTHVDLFGWHLGLSDPHPFASHPLSWPLSLRPTGMFFDDLGGGSVSAVSPLPNVIVTWGGVIALVFLIVMVFRNPRFDAAIFAVTAYLAGWIPWVATVSRSAVFQFYLVVSSPFLAIALALALAVVSERITLARPPFASHSRIDRRRAVALIIGAAVVLGLAFWPMWSGTPQPSWFREMHLWLPGWR